MAYRCPIGRSKQERTPAYAKEAMGMLFGSTEKFESEHFQISWHTVDCILKDRFERAVSTKSIRNLRPLAIDETGIGRSHIYLTTAINADTGEPVSAR
jgi:hypothetical protein